MKGIKNIIFDFDGTLADTSGIILATTKKSVEELGLPEKTEEEIKSTIGLRLEEIPNILWPDNEGNGKIFAECYRRNFNLMKDKIKVNLFPGVKDILRVLSNKKYKMAIATSRSKRSVMELTEQLEIKGFFGLILGGDDVSEGKPNAESIYKIISLTDWEPENTIMIGDMPVDILMGKNAGVRTCGVTYGNGKESDLRIAGADRIIMSFYNLPDVID